MHGRAFAERDSLFNDEQTTSAILYPIDQHDRTGYRGYRQIQRPVSDHPSLRGDIDQRVSYEKYRARETQEPFRHFGGQGHRCGRSAGRRDSPCRSKSRGNWTDESRRLGYDDQAESAGERAMGQRPYLGEAPL